MNKFIIKNTIKQDLEELKNEDFVKFIIENNQSEKNVAADTTLIIDDVKKNGDAALIKYANKFDQTDFKSPKDLLVTKDEIAKAVKILDKDIKKWVYVLDSNEFKKEEVEHEDIDFGQESESPY